MAADNEVTCPHCKEQMVPTTVERGPTAGRPKCTKCGRGFDLTADAQKPQGEADMAQQQATKTPTPAAPETPTAPDPSKQPELSLDERMSNVLLSGRTRRKRVNPAEFKKQLAARKALLVSRLEAHQSHRTRYEPDMVRQMEFELTAIANGTWSPGRLMPQGKLAQVTEAIMGGPRIPGQNQPNSSDMHVDSLLTGEDD